MKVLRIEHGAVTSIVLDLIVAVYVNFAHGSGYAVWVRPIMGNPFCVKGEFGFSPEAYAEAERWAHSLSGRIAGFALPSNWALESAL